MQAVTTIGLDIAKSIFQVHGIDAAGNVLIRRQLKRRYRLGVLREAFAVFNRDRGLCHLASLVAPAQGARPYRALDAAGLCKALRQAAEEHATDAEAICEAGTRANMRFVETKTPEQQSCLMLHRTRQLFIRQQTSVINAIRAIWPSSGSLPRWDASGRNFSASIGLVPKQHSSGGKDIIR